MTTDPAARALLLRRLRFAGLNGALILIVLKLIFAPLAATIVENSASIEERSDQLMRLKIMAVQSAALKQQSPAVENLFLAATQERLASADLQATLKAIAATTNARFLGVRSVAPGRPIAPRPVAVGLDLEGSPASMRDAIDRIETKRPMLFVTSMILRPVAGVANGALRSEITVQGAMQNGPANASVAERQP